MPGNHPLRSANPTPNHGNSFWQRVYAIGGLLNPSRSRISSFPSYSGQPSSSTVQILPPDDGWEPKQKTTGADGGFPEEMAAVD